MGTVMGYLLSRLAEQSTWRGMIWVAVSLGLIPVESQDQMMQYAVRLIQGATALVGIIGIVFPDCSDWITRALGYQPAQPARLPDGKTGNTGMDKPLPPHIEEPPHNGFGDK